MTGRLLGLIAGLVIALTAQTTMAREANGDWLGTLAVSPAMTLHVAVHLYKDPAGAMTGTFDSLDQGVYDLPVAAVDPTGGALAFSVPRLHATYAAKWDDAGHGWIGQWTQGGRSLPLTLIAGVAPAAPTVAGLDGDWDGVLTMTAGIKLRLALHVETGPRGTLARLNSIDQQAIVPVSKLIRDGDKARIEVSLIGGVFEAAVDPKDQTLTGTWTQGGVSLPLVLARRPSGQAAATLRRPQTPMKPYPYREEEVTFDGSAKDVKLAGTLTLPSGPGPFPAVVLVAGSGPNTRNEPIMGHQIFLVLADHLTRHGLAVLRYDKRGTGASTGDYAKATTRDFASDAEAAAAYLRGRKEIDPARVGLIGHSEGGLIAPMVAVADPRIDFIVLMAGPGVDGGQVLSEQGRLISKAAGMTDEQVADDTRLRDQIIAIVRAEQDPDVAAKKIRALFAADPRLKDVPPAAIEAPITLLNSAWFRFFFDYDPATTLRRVRQPVLALIGAKDLQVPGDRNLPAIRAALAGNPDAQIEELPSLNHLFQTAKTGAVSEYGENEETIAPLALDTITRWIVKHVGPPAH